MRFATSTDQARARARARARRAGGGFGFWRLRRKKPGCSSETWTFHLFNPSVEYIFNSVAEDKNTRLALEEELLDQVFSCLADPSRRRILGLLREAQELKVGDIAAVFSMSLNGVSKHLKVLEAAGLIQRRIDGREHWLSVHWAALQPAYEWLHFHHHFWSERLDALVDYVQTQPPKKGKQK